MFISKKKYIVLQIVKIKSSFFKFRPLKTDDVLFEVPEHLRKSTTKKSEEMLSNQMLSGIPEVDLGIE